jgi:N-acetylmuramoyl-L-alanine amidase
LIRRSQFIGIIAIFLLGFTSAAEEKRLAVYSPQANFTVPVVDHDSHDYVSVTDLLDPFGRTSLVRDGKRWRLTYEASGKNLNGEFTDGSAEAKIRGKKISLGYPFWVNGARGYISMSSATVLLSQLLGANIYLRGNSRRLFVGEVSTTYSTELQKGNPSRLVFHFSAPVNPSVATEPGRVHMTFSREPVVAGGVNPQTFDDPAIRSATFVENNGAAELTIATAAPVLATFSDGNKTITLSAAPTPPAPAQALPTSQPTAANPNPPTTTEQVPSQPGPGAQAPRFLVVIDPAHGGDDAGATLAAGLFEKDVTLAIARRIRNDLDQRGIGAILLREGDSTLSFDQRAASANTSRAAIYVSVHAATLGSGVRIYTARFNSPVTIPDHGFLPWETAQAKFLDRSHSLAASLLTEFDAHKVHAIPLEAGLRPLRNIAKPAIAVEVAPPAGTVDGLTSVAYQQAVASSIAAAIANLRPAEASR